VLSPHPKKPENKYMTTNLEPILLDDSRWYVAGSEATAMASIRLSARVAVAVAAPAPDGAWRLVARLGIVWSPSADWVPTDRDDATGAGLAALAASRKLRAGEQYVVRPLR
jgi:hypothetical protein